MPEEIGSTLNYLSNIKINIYGDLKIHSGEWIFENDSINKVYVSIAWSGWGKVSSARAATRLISNKFKEKYLDVLFFFGVAGAIDSKLKQGDLIISSRLVQHDMDARPIFNKYVIPPLNEKFLLANPELVNWSSSILKKATLREFGTIYTGLVATGDKFLNERTEVKKLKAEFPDLLGVEMEGASVAQVAIQEKIPWQILRVISDSANDSSQKDFEQFLKIYKKNSASIVKVFVDNIFKAPLI